MRLCRSLPVVCSIHRAAWHDESNRCTAVQPHRSVLRSSCGQLSSRSRAVGKVLSRLSARVRLGWLHHKAIFAAGTSGLDDARDQGVRRVVGHSIAGQLVQFVGDRDSTESRDTAGAMRIVSSRELQPDGFPQPRGRSLECRWSNRSVDWHQFPLVDGSGRDALPSHSISMLPPSAETTTTESRRRQRRSRDSSTQMTS